MPEAHVVDIHPLITSIRVDASEIRWRRTNWHLDIISGRDFDLMVEVGKN